MRSGPILYLKGGEISYTTVKLEAPPWLALGAKIAPWTRSTIEEGRERRARYAFDKFNKFGKGLVQHPERKKKSRGRTGRTSYTTTNANHKQVLGPDDLRQRQVKADEWGKHSIDSRNSARPGPKPIATNNRKAPPWHCIFTPGRGARHKRASNKVHIDL